jgi:hypothetical protein
MYAIFWELGSELFKCMSYSEGLDSKSFTDGIVVTVRARVCCSIYADKIIV